MFSTAVETFLANIEKKVQKIRKQKWQFIQNERML
jgi:hypothetical protein